MKVTSMIEKRLLHGKSLQPVRHQHFGQARGQGHKVRMMVSGPGCQGWNVTSLCPDSLVMWIEAEIVQSVAPCDVDRGGNRAIGGVAAARILQSVHREGPITSLQRHNNG